MNYCLLCGKELRSFAVDEFANGPRRASVVCPNLEECLERKNAGDARELAADGFAVPKKAEN